MCSSAARRRGSSAGTAAWRCSRRCTTNVHGFDITYEIDLATARIVRADHQTPRLPYAGLCTEPQRKLAALLGETADAGLARRLQRHLGGPTGCAQLFDLTADVLRLLA